MGKHALTNRKSSLQQDYKIRAEVNKKKNNFNFLWIVLLILVLFIWLMNKNTLELKNISPPDEFNKNVVQQRASFLICHFIGPPTNKWCPA